MVQSNSVSDVAERACLIASTLETRAVCLTLANTLKEQSVDGYLIKRDAIESMQGLAKTHFLNHKAQRTNKSLGDLTGLTGFGFHIIEVPPGALSTECHVHQFEDEAVYVLEGSATARIGDEQVSNR